MTQGIFDNGIDSLEAHSALWTDLSEGISEVCATRRHLSCSFKHSHHSVDTIGLVALFSIDFCEGHFNVNVNPKLTSTLRDYQGVFRIQASWLVTFDGVSEDFFFDQVSREHFQIWAWRPRPLFRVRLDRGFTNFGT